METAQTVRFLRRRNLGNYEHAELEVTDVLQSGGDKTQSVKSLMTFVADALFETGSFSASGKVESKTNTASVTKEKPSSEGKKEDASKLKADTKEEEKKAEDSKKDDLKKDDLKKDDKPPRSQEAKRTAKGSPKAATYDRTLDTHKKLLGNFLDGEFPKWKDGELFKKACAASKELNGTDFQDDNGDIIESFKEAYRKRLA